MAEIIPNDAAEQDDEQFDRRDPIELCDYLAGDRCAARGIYLAVSGLQGLGAAKADIDAICELVDDLEQRLRERHGLAKQLQQSIATHLDEGALRRPGEGYWHRDSQLQDAWKEWQAAMRAYKESPESESDRLFDVVTDVEKRIEEMHACTPLGLAVKLRYLFHELEVSPATQDALVYGEPVTDDLLQCPRQRLGWSVVQIAERLARPAAGRA